MSVPLNKNAGELIISIADLMRSGVRDDVAAACRRLRNEIADAQNECKPELANRLRTEAGRLLALAAELGDAEAVKCLRAAGADPAVEDTDGNRPLEAAVQAGSPSCTRLLAGVTTPDSRTYAIPTSNAGRRAALATCLQVRPDTAESATPALEDAIRREDAETVETLLDHGAQADERTLRTSVRAPIEIVDLLIARGARYDLLPPSNGWTLTITAAAEAPGATLMRILKVVQPGTKDLWDALAAALATAGEDTAADRQRRRNAGTLFTKLREACGTSGPEHGNSGSEAHVENTNNPRERGLECMTHSARRIQGDEGELRELARWVDKVVSGYNETEGRKSNPPQTVANPLGGILDARVVDTEAGGSKETAKVVELLQRMAKGAINLPANRRPATHNRRLRRLAGEVAEMIELRHLREPSDRIAFTWA